jgi:hypothetical protein
MCCWTCRWTMQVWRQGRGVRNVSSGSLALAKGLRVATLDQRVINQGLPRSLKVPLRWQRPQVSAAAAP